MYRAWPLLLLVSLFLMDVGSLRAAPTPNPLPTPKSDPTWGEVAAPVTLIAFSDLQCPYCDRVLKTLHALRKDFGKKKLRIVHKHFPLAFHKDAHFASQVGAALQTLEGSDAFFAYQDEIFAALDEGDTPMDLVRDLGFDDAKVQALLDAGKPKKKVDADMALGTQVGARGTPAFFINGVFLSGAQPKANFAAAIDEQLAAAAKLRKRGIPAAQVSDRLTRENFAAKAGKPGSTVWRVPIEQSPTLGDKGALVTLVLFSDFQCPYCGKVMPTVDKLRNKYGKQLRVVFKHNPLSFHKRADAASQLAIEAHVRKGDPGFWAAVDKLFASKGLDDAELERIAGELQLDAKATMSAVQSRKHKERIEADRLLARDVDATGTPSSYINGRKLSGSANAARFETIIDEELAKAKKLLASGIPRSRLYAHIMKKAKGPPPPPKRSAPKVDKQTPVRGKRFAKVTVQIFVDFESAFWPRAIPAMKRIEKHFKGKVRVAFRHKPLPFHKNARRAHAAAQEAFAQKGHAGFWKMYDLIAADPHSLDEETLLAHAEQLGMSLPALKAAWEDDRHAARIDADIQRASDRNISSVPAFLVGDYYLSGAQSFLQLKRVVELALQ